MEYRPLGSTGLDVSVLAFGCGPVADLMTERDTTRQSDVIERAIESGVNWFDTAAAYGDGASEEHLGNILTVLGARSKVHVATKVRLFTDELGEIEDTVRRSVEGSLTRLGLDSVTLLQLHNAITAQREDEPGSITPNDVLGEGGVLETFQKLRSEGLARHIGLTGVGEKDALARVIDSGGFETVQAPYNVLNRSAARPVDADFSEADYGDLVSRCAARGMGFLAIRVYAGGALSGNPPSPYTYTTKYFPLDLYQRDQERAQRLAEKLEPTGVGAKEATLRFVLGTPGVTSAIIGFGTAAEVDAALEYASAGPLPPDVATLLESD